jgi:DNA polymerase III delta subunit
MKLGLDTLATHLQGGRVAPAYLVSGDEPLLVGEAVDALRRSARQQGYTEREVHFPERAGDWAQIDASAGSLSLFGDRRILEVRFSGKAGKEGGAVLQRLIDLVVDLGALIAKDRGESSCRLHVEWMRERRRCWICRTNLSIHMLQEAAAAMHIQELHAAADAEDWELSRVGGGDRLPLQRVTRRVHLY